MPDPDARPLRRLVPATGSTRSARGIAAIALMIAIFAVTAAVLSGERNGQPGRVRVLARESGAAGVAAAYGYPLRCLSVTILTTDRTYARADFNHVSACGRYTGYPTAIFHRVGGAWRTILDAVEYACPVHSLPVAVETELGVCARAQLSPELSARPCGRGVASVERNASSPCRGAGTAAPRAAARQ